MTYLNNNYIQNMITMMIDDNNMILYGLYYNYYNLHEFSSSL